MDRFSRDLFSSDSLRREFGRDEFNLDHLSLDPFGSDISLDRFTRDLSSLDGDMSFMQNVQYEEIITEYKTMGGIKDPKKKKTLLELIRKKGSAAYNNMVDLLKKDEADKSKSNKDLTTLNASFGALDFGDAARSSLVPQTSVERYRDFGDAARSSVVPQTSVERYKDTPVGSITRQVSDDKVTDPQKFLKKNRKSLVEKVKNVDELADGMENFTDGQRSKIHAMETDQSKMRLVLEYTTSTTAAACLVKVLYQNRSDVMQDLTNG